MWVCAHVALRETSAFVRARAQDRPPFSRPAEMKLERGFRIQAKLSEG